jgi:hypothetical protein
MTLIFLYLCAENKNKFVFGTKILVSVKNQRRKTAKSVK